MTRLATRSKASELATQNALQACNASKDDFTRALTQ